LSRAVGSRFSNFCEDSLLESRNALHGCDDVWNQIGATLHLVLDQRPLGLDVLLLGNQLVVATEHYAADDQNDQDDDSEHDQKCLIHLSLLFFSSAFRLHISRKLKLEL